MDILHICVCLIAFLACPSFGQDNYELKFVNSSQRDVSVGAERIKFRCVVTTGDNLRIRKNPVIYNFVNPLTNQSKRMSMNSMIDADPDYYKLNGIRNGYPREYTVEFTIKKVRDEDDGRFECRYRDKKTEVEVVVHRPLEFLNLKFGDNEPVSKTPADPITIDYGKYAVSCIAEGSNPATTDVHLFFDGVMVEHDEPFKTQMPTPKRKFRTTVNADVNVMVKDSGKEFDCRAKDSEGNVFSTKLRVEVNIYDPEVFCNDTEAFHGQDNPIISCTVNHTNLEVTGYAYQIGEKGEIIKEGDQHDKNIKVTVSNVAPGVTVVSLDLHKARPEYLDKDYYILIDLKGGHTSKESVRMHSVTAPETENAPETEDEGNPGDYATRISSSVFLYALMGVLLFWSL